jgi:hypothetical protein
MSDKILKEIEKAYGINPLEVVTIRITVKGDTKSKNNLKTLYEGNRNQQVFQICYEDGNFIPCPE